MDNVPVLTLLAHTSAVLFGAHGDVAAAAQQSSCSRQTVYNHAHKVHDTLLDALLPGHDYSFLLAENASLRAENQQLRQQRDAALEQLAHAVVLAVHAQQHFAVQAHARGISFNTIQELLAVLLGHTVVPRPDDAPPRVPDRSTIARWVHHYSQRARVLLPILDSHTRPLIRVLAPDEIFFHGKPVLVAVDPYSMAVLHCQRCSDRTSQTWFKVLSPFDKLELVIADQGSGLQAGFDLFNQMRRKQTKAPLEVGLDVFHIEKEARAVLARGWRQVEKAWHAAEAVDQRQAKAVEQRKDGRTVAGLRKQSGNAWLRAERFLNWHERLTKAWERAKGALAVFKPDGTLTTRAWAQAEIEAACAVLKMDAWRKVRAMLRARRTLTFVDRLHRKLAEGVPDESLRKELVELWRLGHSGERTVGKVAEAAVQQVICAGLDREWVKQYERVKAILGGVVRASSAVECVNSVLRMQQARHRNVSQEMLDLKRLYWNTRPFRSGKRRGRCPYQLLGASLPTFDFWKLLQYDPEKLSQELSKTQLVA